MTIEEAVREFGTELLSLFSASDLLEVVTAEEAAEHFDTEILGNFSVNECLEYHGYRQFLDEISSRDIAEHCGGDLLDSYDVTSLVEAINIDDFRSAFSLEEILENFSRQEIADEVGHRIVGYLDTELIISDLSERNFTESQSASLSLYGGALGFLRSLNLISADFIPESVTLICEQLRDEGFYDTIANFVEEN